MELRRLTTRYDPKEDRLKLVGEVKPGQTIVLWFTQRMMNSLVTALAKHLEKTSDPLKNTDAVQSNLKQTFAQQRAHADLPKQAPVKAMDSLESWLVQTVDIKSKPSGIRLRFRGETEEQQTQVELAQVPLRQWLNIVHGQYRKAGWSTSVWPVWIEESRAVEPNARTMVLH
jgi:hypothetical protein